LREEKNVEWIADKISKTIEIMGSSNIVQVITNNACSCKAVGAILESRYDHIFWTPCVIHSLNLAFKSIVVEFQWIRNLAFKSIVVEVQWIKKTM
jgi:hypothetical protein